MSEKTYTQDEIAEAIATILNEFQKQDPGACNALLGHRVAANEQLREHPDITTDMLNGVGALGLINGICHRLTGHNIAAEVVAIEGRTCYHHFKVQRQDRKDKPRDGRTDVLFRACEAGIAWLKHYPETHEITQFMDDALDAVRCSKRCPQCGESLEPVMGQVDIEFICPSCKWFSLDTTDKETENDAQ